MTGTITAAAAAATGLRAGTPVVAGGGDQSANAVGVGAVSSGTVALSLGTSGVVFADHRPAAPRAARPRARLLPRRAGSLAPDVGHALGRRQPALVPRRARAGRSPSATSSAEAAEVPGRQRRPALPALPDRRAQPAPRPAGARRLRRPDHAPRAAPPDPGRPRGRRLRPARRAGPDARRRACPCRPRSGRRAAARSARSGARSWPTCSAPRSRPSTRPRARPTVPVCWRPSGRAGSRPSRRPRRACVTRDAGGDARARTPRRYAEAHAGLPGSLSGAGADLSATGRLSRGRGSRPSDRALAAQLDGRLVLLGRPRRASCPG